MIKTLSAQASVGQIMKNVYHKNSIIYSCKTASETITSYKEDFLRISNFNNNNLAAADGASHSKFIIFMIYRRNGRDN